MRIPVGPSLCLACMIAILHGRSEAREPLEQVRGVTIGPIEHALHPGIGYGSPAFVDSLRYVSRIGGNWVSITPFGRVADLQGNGIDLTFETPFEENRALILRAIRQAHRLGLRVMLVPHLWVESKEWRALIDPKTEAGWRRWTESYRRFVLTWAAVAEEAHADLFSVGVELRSWVTSGHVTSFLPILREIRSTYHGPLTYSANWDDAAETIFWGELDAIGINAFFPLVDRAGASVEEHLDGGKRVRMDLEKLGRTWGKPVLFTEMGYTTIRDPALRPWEWPDSMNAPNVVERDQAIAYRGLLEPMHRAESFLGFFVWRIYAQPYDLTQEAPWGFSPQGKLAESELRLQFSDAARRY